MEKSRVFEDTYRKYLAEIGTIDYLGKADILRCARDGDRPIIPLYDRRYQVSSAGILAEDGEATTTAVRVILSRYVLHCQNLVPFDTDPYRTFRDFRNSSPLISYFTANTNKTLEQTFAGKLTLLAQACRGLGGVAQENASYDCSMLFYALPRIPVVLNFNDRDEMFPASCSILYRASAEKFLDMECLAMTGTLLSGRLISA